MASAGHGLAPIHVDVPARGVARWFGSWVWAAPDEPSGAGPAGYAMARLAGWTAAAVRVGIAIVAAAAGLIGMDPPASAAWVVPAVLANCTWAGVFAYVAVRRGLATWAMASDVAVAVVLCLVQGRLVPAAALSTGASWVAVVASLTIVIAHLAWRTAAAVTAGVAVVAGFLIGFQLAGTRESPVGQSIIFAVQIGVSAVLMRLVRGAADAVDTALAGYQRAGRDAAVDAARRAAERDHNRDLHDTVLATLTVVGTGAIADESPTLPARAAADLAHIERLVDLPIRDHRPIRLDERLADVASSADPRLHVELDLAACTVPANVAAAFCGACAQALANVAAYAGVTSARLHLSSVDGRGEAEVCDDGGGFDPAAVARHKYGIREAIVGRMRAVGGDARVDSAPGHGTHVVMWWPHA